MEVNESNEHQQNTEKSICLPGQRICLADKDHVPGNGTYEQKGYIYSMLAGVLNITTKDNVNVIQVKNFNNQTIIPMAGDVVTAKVTLTNPRFCRCIIKCIGETVLHRPYRAILRKEDVRATEKDKVDIYKSFKAGDIILARVLPLTELHVYHLTTAENELGVVIAYSDAGIQMVPFGWTEMQCPKTLVKQPRKVASVRAPKEVSDEKEANS